MKRTKHVVALVLPAFAAISSAGSAFGADTYQMETGLSYARVNGDGFRQNTAGVDGTYYFDKLPAQPKDTPYDEVPFVGRVGSLTLAYDWNSINTDNVERLSNGYDYGATVRYAQPGSYVRAAAGFTTMDSGKTRSAGLEYESQGNSYLASLGAYVAETTSVDLIWTKSKSEGSVNQTRATDVASDSIALVAHHLASLPGGNHLAINANVTQTTYTFDGSSSTTRSRHASVGATYYPTNTLGLTLGISASFDDNNSLSNEGYMVGAKMFFTPAFSLSLNYQKVDAKKSNFLDSDSIAIRAALRF